MKDCPLVLITWEDSRQPAAAWVHLRGLSMRKPVLCTSVGWLVQDTPGAKVLAQSIGDLDSADDVQASGVMTIPTRCVIAIERLVEQDDEAAAA